MIAWPHRGDLPTVSKSNVFGAYGLNKNTGTIALIISPSHANMRYLTQIQWPIHFIQNQKIPFLLWEVFSFVPIFHALRRPACTSVGHIHSSDLSSHPNQALNLAVNILLQVCTECPLQKSHLFSTKKTNYLKLTAQLTPNSKWN